MLPSGVNVVTDLLELHTRENKLSRITNRIQAGNNGGGNGFAAPTLSLPLKGFPNSHNSVSSEWHSMSEFFRNKKERELHFRQSTPHGAKHQCYNFYRNKSKFLPLQSIIINIIFHLVSHLFLVCALVSADP